MTDAPDFVWDFFGIVITGIILLAVFVVAYMVTPEPPVDLDGFQRRLHSIRMRELKSNNVNWGRDGF